MLFVGVIGALFIFGTLLLSFVLRPYEPDQNKADIYAIVDIETTGGKYNEEGKFLPWVVRIARNLAIDHFRKSKRMPTITSQDGEDIFGDGGNSFITRPSKINTDTDDIFFDA